MLLDPASRGENDPIPRLVLRDDVVGNRLGRERIPELRAERADGSHVVQADAHRLPEPALPFETEVHVGERLPHLGEVVKDRPPETAENRIAIFRVEGEEPVPADDVGPGGAVVALEIGIPPGAGAVARAAMQRRARVVVDRLTRDPEEIALESPPRRFASREEAFRDRDLNVRRAVREDPAEPGGRRDDRASHGPESGDLCRELRITRLRLEQGEGVLDRGARVVAAVRIDDVVAPVASSIGWSNRGKSLSSMVERFSGFTGRMRWYSARNDPRRYFPK